MDVWREPASSWFVDGESSEGQSRPSSSASSFFSTFESLPSASPLSTPRIALERPSTAGSDQPSTASLPRLISNLVSLDDEEKSEAVIQLALLIDCSAQEEMEAIGERIRSLGGIERLVQLLEHPDASIHQSALLILGNLSTDTVDPDAEATKTLLKAHGGFAKLLPHLSSHNKLTVAYALGAVQNTCMDFEYVGVMQQSGAVARLQELLVEGNPRLSAYARNCLMNLRQTLVTAAARRQPAR
uniref:Armadillo repeat-containing protein 8 n=1 Tax=Haptolina ericina TaxID=156174 RepID=A0A7S3B412_9EUKA|mmetsp:Transcript_46516/g.104850  ORF Transcript_46516/g.104850 Transcript_46516/m.104850 type:complete len:243 (+) Transcript_46516:26-754(+)